MKPYGIEQCPIGTGMISGDTCKASRYNRGGNHRGPCGEHRAERKAMTKRARQAAKTQAMTRD